MTFHPVSEEILSLLSREHVWHERFEHAPVRTSEEAARVRPDYTLDQGAKALIVRLGKAEKRFAMLVLPGNRRFDAAKARRALAAADIRFAREEEVGEITGGVLPGGVPPFGNLFGIAVYADASLFGNERIIFNAGDRRVSVAMKSEDYRRLVAPQVVELT